FKWKQPDPQNIQEHSPCMPQVFRSELPLSSVSASPSLESPPQWRVASLLPRWLSARGETSCAPGRPRRSRSILAGQERSAAIEARSRLPGFGRRSESSPPSGAGHLLFAAEREASFSLTQFSGRLVTTITEPSCASP